MSEWKPYEHRVQYYETDQMGIVHHSNYIRWFEEARLDFMRQAGVRYKDVESAGIIIPVIEVQAEYRSMVRFDDIVQITVKTEKYNGVVMSLSYEITDKESGERRCCGSSKHCFLDENGKPCSMKHVNPEFHQKFMEMK